MDYAEHREIGRLLDEAEGEGRCAYVAGKARSQALRRHIKFGEIVEPKPLCFARTSWWRDLDGATRHLAIVRTVAHVREGCVFCRESAAVAYGLSLSYVNLQEIHLATSRKSHSRDSKLACCHVVEGDGLHDVGGLVVTSPERTVFDCTRYEQFPDALAVVDSALRRRVIERSSYQEYIDAHRRFPGTWRAQRALDFADPRAENGGESVARGVMIELGFEIPELQIDFVDELSGKKIRPDFLWTLDGGSKIAGELDGDQKYENPIYMGGRDVTRVLTDERKRESRLTIKVGSVCRLSLRDVYDRAGFERLLDEFGVPRVIRES